MANITNLILFSFILLTLKFVESANIPFTRSYNFDKWLQVLQLRKTDGVDWTKFTFDKIDEAIDYWKKQGVKYSSRIPPKLLSIKDLNLANCNKNLISLLEPELTRDLNSEGPGDQYFRYFAKLQFNMCLQDMELRRAQLAAKSMDKSKWIAWFDAMNSGDNHSTGANLEISSQKLANYLKHYVPGIDVGSSDEQMKKVDSEIKSIVDAICPYVTREAIANAIHRPNMIYLDEKRSVLTADPEASIWISSKNICKDKKLQDELVKSVANNLINKLNSLKLTDQNLASMSDGKIASDILFSSDGKLSSVSVRAGNHIELLQKLAEFPGDNQSRAIELIKFQNFDLELPACRSENNERRSFWAEKYSENESIGIYIKAMNALQYHVCDTKFRWEAALLAENLPSIQIARLAELVYINKCHQSQGETKTSVSQFVNSKVSFGISAKIFIKRQYKYMQHEFNSDNFDYNKSFFSEFVANDADRADLKRGHWEILSDKMKVYYKDVMGKTCQKVAEKMPFIDVSSVEKLLTLEKNSQIGELSIELFDYVILCHYSNEESGFEDFMKALKNP